MSASISCWRHAHIWHAYAWLDESRRGEQIKHGQLKVLTHNIASCFGRGSEVVAGMDEYFERVAPGGVISFEQYLAFLDDTLFNKLLLPLANGGPPPPNTDALDKVAEICWMVCAKAYIMRPDPVLSDDIVFRLWQVFNMLAETGEEGEEGEEKRGSVLPPHPIVMDREEVDLVLQRLHRSIGRDYDRRAFLADADACPRLTFAQLLEQVEQERHLGGVDRVIANEAVNELYEEHFVGVLKKGYLSKKGPPMMPWKDRFCILTPQHLRYYTNADLTEQKGEIKISDSCTVKVVPERSGTKSHRFILTAKEGAGSPREYEFSAQDHRSQVEWITALKLAISKDANLDRVDQIMAELKLRRIEKLAQRMKLLTEEEKKERDARRHKETEEQLEAERIANAEAQAYVKELEEMQQLLQQHLEAALIAKEQEEASRLEKERALKQEADMRRELELLQASLKDELNREAAKCEELAQRQAEQENRLVERQRALQELKEERERRDQEYKEALERLEKAERVSENVRAQLERKKGWRPPEVKSPMIIYSHRGKGAYPPFYIDPA